MEVLEVPSRSNEVSIKRSEASGHLRITLQTKRKCYEMIEWVAHFYCVLNWIVLIRSLLSKSYNNVRHESVFTNGAMLMALGLL